MIFRIHGYKYIRELFIYILNCFIMGSKEICCGSLKQNYSAQFNHNKNKIFFNQFLLLSSANLDS